jgi:NDP-sugar pyrophosphorylase family protein
LVLAGGEGTRLKPVTEKIPKPMVEVNGKPFLEFQLELLAKNGITEVVLCVGYLWDQIQDYFSSSFTGAKGDNIKLHYSVEPRFIGTGGAIKLAEKLVDDIFFMVYGDSLLPIDYQELGQLIYNNNVLGVVTVYDNHDKIVNNNMLVDENGYITLYDKLQETPEMNGVEAGVAVFKKELLGYLPTQVPENQKISLEVDIYPKLIEEKKLLGYMSNERFYDMGTFDRLEIISEVLK